MCGRVGAPQSYAELRRHASGAADRGVKRKAAGADAAPGGAVLPPIIACYPTSYTAAESDLAGIMLMRNPPMSVADVEKYVRAGLLADALPRRMIGHSGTAKPDGHTPPPLFHAKFMLRAAREQDLAKASTGATAGRGDAGAGGGRAASAAGGSAAAPASARAGFNRLFSVQSKAAPPAETQPQVVAGWM